MTQKRFTLEEFGLNFIVNDNGRNLTAKQTVDRLNELNDENEQLKSRVEYLERKIGRERTSYQKQHEKWEEEIQKENEQLKAQLYCDSEEGVCSICKHHYLEKGNIFYISKCEKGHEKCSKESVRHCEDFEVKELENDQK